MSKQSKNLVNHSWVSQSHNLVAVKAENFYFVFLFSTTATKNRQVWPNMGCLSHYSVKSIPEPLRIVFAPTALIYRLA